MWCDLNAVSKIEWGYGSEVFSLWVVSTDWQCWYYEITIPHEISGPITLNALLNSSKQGDFSSEK